MKKLYSVSSAEETEKIGHSLAKELDDKKIKRAFIALFGEMGVGKTAFSRGFASYFDIKSVKSPTYTVLNEYKGRVNIHHFDFYRIKSLEEVFDIGYEDYFYGGSLCLLEWPELIDPLMPDHFIKVEITLGDTDDSRVIKVSML